jgi:hypothetical protein
MQLKRFKGRNTLGELGRFWWIILRWISMKLEYNACNLPFHQIISEKIEQLNGKLV